jgi:hypothetical protein
MKQSREQFKRLIKSKLIGNLGTYSTKSIERGRRGWVVPTRVDSVWEPLAKVTM